jgi:hypothetical protein
VLAARTEAFYAEIRRFAGQYGIPVVEFASGQRKDDVMCEHLEQFLAAGRTRRDAEGKSYPWIVRASRVVTQWYFYCYDSCAGPFFVKYCDSFDENVIWDLAAKWTAILPCPFTPEDTAAGLIFARRIIRKGPRATPGRFRTRVLTDGVVPTLHVDCKHSKIKQYHKEGKALRTETTINDTRDFGIGKRLQNLPALRAAGFTAARREAPASLEALACRASTGLRLLEPCKACGFPQNQPCLRPGTGINSAVTCGP